MHSLEAGSAPPQGAVTTGKAGEAWGPETHLLDVILLIGCRDPDCGVTSAWTPALTVEFWRFPVSREKHL